MKRLLCALFGLFIALPVFATCTDYVSATGTVTQTGTPTPEHPITPTFYTQGNMVLRAVGNVADSYDATTGKITRWVGVKVLDGTEDVTMFNETSLLVPLSPAPKGAGGVDVTIIGTHFVKNPEHTTTPQLTHGEFFLRNNNVDIFINYSPSGGSVNLDTFKAFLAQQYAAGTPVTVYYPLETATTEDWSETQYGNTCNGCHPYTTATGTVTQNGTPTPTNPITPTFYTQGNMVLRKINDTYYDSYDATTGKITRRVGVGVLNGTEEWKKNSDGVFYVDLYFPVDIPNDSTDPISTHYRGASRDGYSVSSTPNKAIKSGTHSGPKLILIKDADVASVDDLKTFLMANNVTIYYPLAEATTEDWAAEQCSSPIKIATTKYNNTAFGPVVTALSNAVDTIKTVVSNTINQATAVANLHSGKQTKPTDTCPAGKTCLLVEDMNGDPHWYEIVESYVAPNTSRLPAGFTELAYLESTGTQYIDTGVKGNLNTKIEMDFALMRTSNTNIGIYGSAGTTAQNQTAFCMVTNSTGTYVFPQFDSVARTTTEAGNLNFVLGQRYHIVQSKDGWYYDNQLGATWENPESFTTPSNLKLFATDGCGTSGANAANSYARIYYTKIWDGDTLVRDLVPAHDGASIGMYDLVNDRFYTDANGGNFTAGPVVLPDGFTTLQYIESTAPAADAYIDTGLNFNSNYIYEITYSKGGKQNVFMGARKDSDWSAKGNFSLTFHTETCLYSSAENASTAADFFDETYGVQHTVKYQQSTSTLLFDGTDNWKLGWINSVEIPYNVYLFAFNNVGTAGGARTGYVRIYSYTVKDANGNLIQQFVPAKQGNTVGMYDLVSGNFKTNEGTGSFTAGPVAQ